MRINDTKAGTLKGSGQKRKDPLATAKQLLENNQVDKAIANLRGMKGLANVSGANELLGAALFRAESYGEAVEAYQAAAAADPENKSIQKELQRSLNNHLAQVQDDVATDNPHDEALQGIAVPGKGDTGPAYVAEPLSLNPIVRAYQRGVQLTKLGLKATGHLIGGLAGLAVGRAAQIFGKEPTVEELNTWARKNLVKGMVTAKQMKEKPATNFARGGGKWTTWSTRPYLKGLMMLAKTRDKLNKENLHDAYPEGELTAFAEKGQRQPEHTKWARTADGSWNNAENPMEGAAWTRFGRNTKEQRDATDEEILFPNPRSISRRLFTRKDGFKEVPFLNMVAASWIQFMNHDWVSHGDNRNGELYEVPLAPDDPMRQKFHMKNMFVPKTATDPTRRADETGSKTHLNEVTHWWDGSQIYGSDLETQKRLRSMEDGKMRVGEDGNLPIAEDGVEDTGFRRNWWTGLSMLHTLFVKEHNAIADKLKEEYPDMTDQRLFDTARLINTAVMAKIHTVEWTPAILPNKMLDSGMAANWYGAATKIFRKGENRKAKATLPLSDSVLGGIVGNKINKHGVAYSLTEEFTAVYRLHNLLPDSMRLHDIDDPDGGVEVPLTQMRQKSSKDVTQNLGMEDLFASFGTQHPGQLVLNNYPEELLNLSVPGFANYDLGAVDLIRDRERIPVRYNGFRENLGLKKIEKFEDLTDDPEIVKALKEEYHNDVELLDIKTGCDAEAHRPDGYGFGETMFTEFILNASRRLQADRFFTDSFNDETYTPEGMKWIDDADMKGVLMRHYPELAKTGLSNIENAFEPWDTGEITPDRHPLREIT